MKLSSKTKYNIFYSVVILIVVCIVLYIMLDTISDPFGMVGFMSLIMIETFSVIMGIIMIILVIQTKKYWNSIPFIIAVLINFLMFSLLLLMAFGSFNEIVAIMTLTPLITLVVQINLFIKFNKLSSIEKS